MGLNISPLTNVIAFVVITLHTIKKFQGPKFFLSGGGERWLREHDSKKDLILRKSLVKVARTMEYDSSWSDFLNSCVSGLLVRLFIPADQYQLAEYLGNHVEFLDQVACIIYVFTQFNKS